MIAKRRLGGAIALLLGTVLAASGSAAQNGSGDYRPSASTDEGGLWMLSDEAEKRVQRSPLLVQDDALNTYIRNLVCEVAGPDCGAIRVYILDLPYFNANMAPNGAMQVWTGLLVRSANEAQLALVLAHEIAHYRRKHTLNRYQSTRDTANALTFLSLATGGLVGGVASLVAAGSLSAYSRDQEREADAQGFDTIVAMGYDPKAGAEIWRQLIVERDADPGKSEPDAFLASHPATDERMETMRRRAAEMEGRKTEWKDGRQPFLAAIKPYRAQWLDAELNRGRLAESRVLVDRLLAGEPDSGLLRYYKAEVLRRQNENSAALSAYRNAIAGVEPPAAAHRGLGLAALKTDDRETAREAFTAYLERAPDADDRAMIEFYLAGL